MILGIDPGNTGAIAWLSTEGHLIEVHDLPVVKGSGLIEAVLVDMIRARSDVHHAWIERVASSPQMGVVSAFNFGMGYGKIKGVLAACGIPLTEVTPAKWKGALRLSSDKSASRARAAQLWPGLAGTFARVKDDGRAEAALIGLYGATGGKGPVR